MCQEEDADESICSCSKIPANLFLLFVQEGWPQGLKLLCKYLQARLMSLQGHFLDLV